MQDQALALLSIIGLASQFATCVLLVTLYALLGRGARRRGYFRMWGRAWLVLAVTLGVLVLRFLLLPRYEAGLARSPVLVHIVFGVYQLGKLLWCALLASGTAQYVHRARQPHRLAWAIGIASAFSVATAVFAPSMAMVIALQGPLAAFVLAYCAWLLLRLPPSRRTLGSAFTGAAFAANAVLWALYAPLFLAYALSPLPRPFALMLVASGNSFLDQIVGLALGYGMVVMMLEDAKREVDAAHAELSVAHHELRRAALSDALTGSLNRRAFEEGVGLEQARGTFGAVGMIDLDDLKAVNDTDGHAAGDALLCRVADAIRGGLRPSDKLYRWGGDEFLLVMPGASADDLVRRIDGVLAVAGDPPLMVSIGAADYEGAEGLIFAIPAADLAMYEEKRRRKLPSVRGPRAVGA